MTIDRLAALEREATPGYWLAEHLVDGSPEEWGVFAAAKPYNTTVALNWYGPDAAFIAAARNAMPELLAVVRAAEEYVSRAPDSHGTALFDDLRDVLAAVTRKLGEEEA